MSSKLISALNTGKVVVKNRTSSSVVITVPAKRGEHASKTQTHAIPGNAAKYLLSDFVDIDEIKRSNIKGLIVKRFLDIV